MIVRRSLFPWLLLFLLSLSTSGEETSFRRVRVPDAKARAVKAVLTFSDQRQAIEIAPAKGASINIPYSQIDKFVYQYTNKHRINKETIATAPIGVGAVVMTTRAKNHWLEIDYRQNDVPKVYVVRMDKHNYLRILEAVKKHTGKDAEVLGNADKRNR